MLEAITLIVFMASGWIATWVFFIDREANLTSPLGRLRPRPWLKYSSIVLRLWLWMTWSVAISAFAYWRVTGGFESATEAADIGIGVLFLSGWVIFGDRVLRAEAREVIITSAGLYQGGFLWRWSWYESIEVVERSSGKIRVKFRVRPSGLRGLWPRMVSLSSSWYEVGREDLELITKLANAERSPS